MLRRKISAYIHRIQFLLICAFGVVGCDQYNLYGEPGQAYSIEVNLGHPYQKINLVVDTGSTTLAVATHQDALTTTYFDYKNSATIFRSGKMVTSKYSEGMWIGHFGSDFIHFPSLPNVPEITTELALITESHDFFMNGSKWQGILGLAYLPIAADGNVLVDSWISSLDRKLDTITSFQLTLCGPASPTNATHYGRFQVFDNRNTTMNPTPKFRTSILRERWYEIGTLAVRAVSKPTNITEDKENGDDGIDREMCSKLNENKDFLDSGTTNIRLPDMIFRQVVDEMKRGAQSSNNLILDEFWYGGEAACWPEPQNWSLPWLAIDLWSYDSFLQYFTIEIPPQNYMRLMSAKKSSDANGTVAQYCYKLGVEASRDETVLGYTAMEGFDILFNRSMQWIGFEPSNCGPKTLIHGPYNTTKCIWNFCQFTKPVIKTSMSIKAAQWALLACALLASLLLIYIMSPCIMSVLNRMKNNPVQISMSHAALVEHDLNT